MFTQSYTEQASSYTEDISPLWFSVCTPCTPCNLSRHPLKTVDFLRERKRERNTLSANIGCLSADDFDEPFDNGSLHTHAHIVPTAGDSYFRIARKSNRGGRARLQNLFDGHLRGAGRTSKHFDTPQSVFRTNIK